MALGADGRFKGICNARTGVGGRFCGTWTIKAPPPPLPVAARTIPLSEVEDLTIDRLGADTWWAPLLGGGIVPGTTILIGGEPGGGKSTLSVQIADAIAEETGLPSLYLAMEEKAGMIRSRAARIGCQHLNRIIVPAEKPTAELEILNGLEDVGFIILDSLPYLAGRDENKALDICQRLTEYAQETDTPILILDHVTKGEQLAGLMTLQHAVDVTIYLRSNHRVERRVWETIKNRHGDGFVTRDLLMTTLGLELAPDVEPKLKLVQT